MSDSESHDLPEPFDPLQHLGPDDHEGDHVEPLGDLEGLFEDHHEPGATNPIAHESYTAPAAPKAPSPAISIPPPSRPIVAGKAALPPGPARHPSGVPALVTVVGTAAVMLGGAYALSKLMPPAEAPAPTPAATTTAATAPAPAVDESKVLSGKFDAMGTTVSGLTQKLDDLQKQVASMPKPAPVPDLKPIETRVADLAKRVESTPAADTKALEDKLEKATGGMNDLSAKLDVLSTRAAEMEKTINADKTALAAIQTKLKEFGEPKPAQAASTDPAPAAATASPTNANANAEAEYAKAVDLFKKNQFPAAKDAFAKLQQSMPNDARVWYYAAMSNGAATQQWLGETEQLVNKGIELEKAGSPDAAKINAAFADLAPSLKPWLDTYRARAR